MAMLRHASHSPCRILIADADVDTRALYRQFLERAGCDVIDAADGRDALVSALAHRPSLVIMDTQLPVFDGYQLCEVFRRDSQTATVPILIVTSESRQPELDRARAAGADVVIIKPTTPEVLVAEVQRHIGRQHVKHRKDTPSSAEPSNGKQPTLSKAHRRHVTSHPPAHPPELVCPSCLRVLVYERSYVGGVNTRHMEQWDTFSCRECGSFDTASARGSYANSI